jgi:RNA polymerase subunit RPABC4/transcription elongation factor Spt4
MPKGKKKCPKCKELVSARVKTCECGHIFAKGSDMPFGYKQCPNCKELIGQRSRRCKLCQWDYDLKEIVEKRSVANELNFDRRKGGGRLVLTPAGRCPVEQCDSVEQWLELIIDYSDKLENAELGPSAIEYWAGSVWGRDSDEFIKLSELINLEYNVQPLLKLKGCIRIENLNEGTKFIDYSGKEGIVINSTEGGVTVKYRITGAKSHISKDSLVKPL